MLKVSFLELFFRGLPESLLFIWAINLINNKQSTKKIYLLVGTFLTIVIYFIRLLPIQLGVNTLIALVTLISYEHYINRLSLIKAISSSLIVVTLLSICEFMNFSLLYLLKINIDTVNNSLFRCIYILPSLLFFVVFILIFNTVNKNFTKGIITNVSN